MKILLVHNYYGSSAPSGENKVFEAEAAMLEAHGNNVALYTRHSDEIRGKSDWGEARRILGMAKGAMCTIGNPFAASDVARLCGEFKPDVVHFHNTFPLISPLAVRAASKYAPVVMTLHNYRTVCAAGVPMKNGRVCSSCLDSRSIWNGVLNRCYRGSLMATIPLAASISIYRNQWFRWVSRFIAFSDFQKSQLIKSGFAADAISIKSNFTEVSISHCRFGRENKNNQIVYVGRLSSEKGLSTLIKAWKLFPRRKSYRLVVIGDGDNRVEYEELARGLSVEFIGKQPNNVVREVIANSLACILPSECWEGMPMTILESFAEGTPCVVSNVGALPEYVRNGDLGEVFEVGNAESCNSAITRILSRPDYDEVSVAARCEAETCYSEKANYARLMAIYHEVVKEYQM